MNKLVITLYFKNYYKLPLYFKRVFLSMNNRHRLHVDFHHSATETKVVTIKVATLGVPAHHLESDKDPIGIWTNSDNLSSDVRQLVLAAFNYLYQNLEINYR